MNLEEYTYEEAVQLCKKGLFILCFVDDVKKATKFFKQHLSFKRGIFTYKGLMVLTVSEQDSSIFDKVIKIKKEV